MKNLMILLCCLLLTQFAFGFEDDALCPRGTFTQTTETDAGPMTTCVDCLAGRFQPEQGQSTCIDCPVGTYQPGPRGELCLPCEIGRYQDETRSGDCKTCPSGTATRFVGAADRSDCLPIGGNLPAMNRWGLALLVVLVLGATTFVLRRGFLSEK